MFKYAIFIDYLEWDILESEMSLNENISFISLTNNKLGPLLRKHLKKLIRYWNEELLNCQTAIIFDFNKNVDLQIEPSEQTYSYSTEIMTILTLIFKTDLGLCRVITSEDNFKSCSSTYTLYDNYPSTIELNSEDLKLNIEKFNTLKKAWLTINTLNYSKYHPRVINALDFYYFAWNAINLHSTAINLSVVLETLFSPSSTNELAHQLAFNISKFVSMEKKQRSSNYQFVKKFYSIRSKLVHGGELKDKELYTIIEFFTFISTILLRIITDINLFNTFNQEKLRKQYIEELMFE